MSAKACPLRFNSYTETPVEMSMLLKKELTVIIFVSLGVLALLVGAILLSEPSESEESGIYVIHQQAGGGVMVEALPNAGWYVRGWVVNGERYEDGYSDGWIRVRGNTLTIREMDQPYNVVAHFGRISDYSCSLECDVGI